MMGSIIRCPGDSARPGADDVPLVLPETGVCSTQGETGEKKSPSCCGGPATKRSMPAVVADAVRKSKKSAHCYSVRADALLTGVLEDGSE